MQAELYDNAAEVFLHVIKEYEDEKEIVPEAMYWCGDSYTKGKGANAMIQAWRMFKKLTWDYPASKWAKYARGRLASPEMMQVEERAMEGGNF